MAEQPPQQKPKAVAILVHGTFAPGAPWTRAAESRLCAKISDEAGQADASITFESHEWTGSNLLSDRISAGALLAERVQGLTESGASVFLVGHSHGGTVVMHALKRLSGHKGVLGAVFMATPFVHIRYRTASESILRWLSFAVEDFAPFGATALFILLLAQFLGWNAGWFALPMYALFAFAVCPIAWWSIGHQGALSQLRRSIPVVALAGSVFPIIAFIPPLYAHLPDWIRTSFFIIGFFLIGLPLALYSMNLAQNTPYAGPRIPRILYAAALTQIEHQFPDVPREKCLFIRAPGDEASAGLGFAQTLDLALGTVLDLPRKWLSYFDLFVFFAIRDPVLRRSPLFKRTILVTLSVIIFIISVFFLIFGLPDRSSAFVERHWVYVWVFLVPGIVAFPIVCYLLIWVVGVGVARAFGTTRALSVFLLQHLVEPLPVGSWMFEQLGTAEQVSAANELDDESPAIAHSVYVHPVAEKTIATWIVSRLTSKGAA